MAKENINDPIVQMDEHYPTISREMHMPSSRSHVQSEIGADPDLQLINPQDYLPLSPNNHHVVFDNLMVKPLIKENLKNHPVCTALTATATWPLIYLQQAWKTIEHVVEGQRKLLDHSLIGFNIIQTEDRNLKLKPKRRLSMLKSMSFVINVNRISGFRFVFITQSEVYVSSASRKVQFAFHSAHAKFTLRFPLVAKSSICVSSLSRKTQFARSTPHAKLSLHLLRLTKTSSCVSLGSRKALFASPTVHANLKFGPELHLLDFENFRLQPNGDNMMKSLTEGPMERLMKVIPATATTLATTVEKALREYDADELLRYQTDNQAKSNLILALPNSIYNRIGCFKQNPMLMWTQLEKIMLGTTVSTQLRQTRYMNNFEEFKAKDGESLKSVFDRFWVVINDLYKIKVTKTELEANLKFLNVLQPEWSKSCHRMRNNVRISTMPIQELYEILMTDETMVLEKKAKLDKKNKPKTVDPISLLASQLAKQALTEDAYDGSTEDDGEALEKAMILLSQHYQKKFQRRSGSNNLRFTSGTNKVEPGAPSKP
ncbi:hypothetical protein L6452_32673 [Arctium lappa]|uniref:Uncharacterized protein n=1 Tax=Arctium lappa TaxID=4217 RepID=A0ACB8Z4C4_ARCLA|nr:hypothetical protein L6452_32673 [Arctium lappa]